MSLKDKLEVGLKPDAAYRPDNLPDFQKGDPACEVAAEPGESVRQRSARVVCATPTRDATRPRRPAKAKPKVRARAARARR